MAPSIFWDLRNEFKAKVLQASTSEVYGDPHVHPQHESYWGNANPIGLRSCYDEGKRCAETLFFDYFRQHKLKIKVARIFNTYGPRMHPYDGRVVSSFIVQALKNQSITVFGDGSQTRSFCYVDDLIEALVRLQKSPDDMTGPVNIGNPEELSILALAKMIIQLTKSRSEIVFKPLPQGDPCRRRPDISLAKEQLNWEPTVTLEEGFAADNCLFQTCFIVFDRDRFNTNHRKTIYIHILAIVLLTSIFYSPSLSNDFIWDDDDYILNNFSIQRPEGLKDIWLSYKTPQYYPVVFTSFWIEYHTWGARPLGYHVVNLMFHIFNALLIYTILLKLYKTLAFPVALIFALHPVHVETVAWITERKNIYGAFFYLLAVWFYT